MKLLVLGDNHGDIENLILFLDKLKKFNVDVVVYTGDFTDPLNKPKKFDHEDIAIITIEELKRLDAELVAVPGNNDTKEIIKILEEEGVSVHGRGKVIGEYGFYGYGGAKTPFGTNLEPSVSEMKLGLENAWKDVRDAKFKIQVTHCPPKDTRLDLTNMGFHVGSLVIRKFIEEKNPIMAACGHIHEARGTEHLGKTFLINPGRLPEGYCGLVVIDENGRVDGKVINIL